MVEGEVDPQSEPLCLTIWRARPPPSGSQTRNQNHVRKPAPIAWDTVANIAAAAAMFPVTGRPPPGWWMVSARREDNKTSSAASLSPPPIAAVVPSRKSSSAALPSSAAVCLRCARSFISASLFAVPDQSCSRSGGGGEAVRHCGGVLHLANPPAPVTRLPASRRCRRRRNFLAVRLPGPSSCLVFLATAAKSSACARDAPRIRPRLSKSTRTAEIKIDAPARGVHLEPNAATSAFRDAGRDKVP